MTRSEAEEIAKVAAREAVENVLERLGIDTKNAAETRADMTHLRSWRQAVERTRIHALLTVVGVLVTGVAGAIWLAIGGRH